MDRIGTTIGLCTDSSAQLPAELVGRFEVAVVPATLRVGDREYLEGVDLDADGFYELLGSGATVETSEPSAGQFAVAYDELVARGCTEILSVHVGSTLSGTVNAARLAAHRAEAPVRIIETAVQSFGVGCCVWALAEALAAGASAEEAAALADSVGPTIGNVFVADPAHCGVHGAPPSGAAGGAGPASMPVLGLRGGALEVVTHVSCEHEAIEAMVERVAAWGSGLRVGVGMGDRSMHALSERLHDALAAHPSVDELVRYRIGPSVGARVGARTAGCFMFPTAL